MLAIFRAFDADARAAGVQRKIVLGFPLGETPELASVGRPRF